jgi:hypothetical protein
MYQQGINASAKDRMKLPATFGVICIAMLMVMTSFAAMAAVPMNGTGSASITHPTVAAANPVPVPLGTAGDFAVLANSGITTTVGSMIIGDIGTSSAAGTITGFGLIPDFSGNFSTSSLVVGRVYAFDYANGTPAKMTAAVGDMGIAYTNASGRVNATGVPDYLNEGAGILEGLTLYQGIHKWTTPVSIGVTVPGNLTLDGQGNSSAVFIFQIAGTLDLASMTGGLTSNVLLTGSAQASNIFWAAAGATTIGTYSIFEGNILTGATSLIAVQTGAKLNGRALGDGTVTLDANNVTAPTGPPGDTISPTITSTIPSANATGVYASAGTYVFHFSEAMNTTAGTNLTTLPGVSWAWSANKIWYNGTYATLQYNTTYYVNLTGFTDLAGNVLSSYANMAFTTGDATLPTIVSTSPTDGATIIATSAGTFVIHFSEAMDNSTGTMLTTLPGVSWTWSADNIWYSGTYTTLSSTTAYYVNLTGYKDLSGNPLNGDADKMFTTGVAAAVIRAPVNLGTAVDFVILAKAGISTTGPTLITGDIGVSPIDQTAITGFSETMDSSNEFSTSTYVVGNIYAADYLGGTPAKMTTAISDMETAYVDAAGRAIPDYTELYAGDVTGQTLTPGLYKWGTGLLISAGGVTISGTASDVWIFQIAQDLTVANGAIITLGGAAQASNIFWQVAGQVTIGTTAQMKGIIMCYTQIAIATSASLDGRAFAQTAVTLQGNAVTEPTVGTPLPFSRADTITPYWRNTQPATINATVNDPNGDLLNVRLYYAMSSDNVTWPTSNNFSLYSGLVGAPWSWSFTFPSGDGYYRFFTVAADNTSYVEPMPVTADAYAAFDSIAPQITTVAPVDGATAVAQGTDVVVRWSEAMDNSSGTVNIVPAPTVAGAWAWSANNIWYNYTGATYASETLYTLTFNNFRDPALNAAAGDLAKAFTMVDFTAPTIQTISPVDGAAAVAQGTNIVVRWSETMDNSVGSVNIVPAPTVVGAWAWSANHIWYNYTGATYVSEILYTLTFSSFRDPTLNAATGDLVKDFTTIDFVTPTIQTITPTDGASVVAQGTTVVARWSEDMDNTIGSVNIVPAPTVAGAWAWSANHIWYNYTGATFVSETLYTLTFNSFRDPALNAATGDLVKTFTTADFAAPTIQTITPADGTTAVAQGTAVVVRWSEDMDNTVGSVNIVPAPTVAGAWAWSANHIWYNYTGATYVTETLYTLTFNSFRDPALNAATGDLVKVFTTADYTIPQITAVTPIDGATGVAQGAPFVTQWSESMDNTVGSVSIVPAPTTAGTWAWSANHIWYNYTGATYASETLYVLTFTLFRDPALNAATGDLIKNFTTNDFVAPTIQTITPADGATTVAQGATVVVRWSEDMDSTVGSVTIVPTPTTAGTWVWSANHIWYNYTGATFASLTRYTMTLNSFRDPALNSATGDLVKNFTTNDFEAPQIMAIVPADNATAILQGTTVVVTWSEAMDNTAGTVAIVPAPTTAGAWSWSSNHIWYNYTGATFATETLYTLNFSSFRDPALNAAVGDLVKNFTTGDFTVPQITTIVPADGATAVVYGTTVVVRWSEAMNNTAGAVAIVPAPITAGAWAWSANHIWYNYTGATFSSATLYTLTFSSFRDPALNNATGDLVKVFTTAAAAPTVGTIIGRVVDENGDAMQNATVSLGETGITTLTDANGDYSFSDVAPGTYTIGFNTTGYEPNTATADVTAGQTTTVPDTTMVPSGGNGANNWWWILAAIAVVLAAAVIGWTLMKKNKGKKDPETPPKK